MDCLSCKYLVTMICCSILSKYDTVGYFSGTAFQPYMYISNKVLFNIEFFTNILFDLMFDSHFLMIILLLLYHRGPH